MSNVTHRQPKHRITRNAFPTKRRAGLVLTGQSIQYDDIRIKRALQNCDLSNEFVVVCTPERKPMEDLENSTTKRRIIKAKRKTPAKKKRNINAKRFEEETQEIQQIQTMFGEVEDFELMKETVPKERYVIKEPKIHKRKAETAKLESIPSTSGTLEQVIQETAGTPITEYSPAPAPRTLEQVQETAETPITEYSKPVAAPKTPEQGQETAETPITEYSPAPAPRTLEQVQETAATPITEYSKPAPAPKTPEQVQETANTPITEYSKPAPGLDLVLDLCDDQSVLSWDHFASSFITSIENCSKLGEGTYGEVFKLSVNGRDTALKIIPFAVETDECTKFVNGDYLKPPTSMYNELFITRELSNLADENQTAINGFVTTGFIRLIQVAIVKGHYPEPLLRAWDRFKQDRPSLAENQRPSEYTTEKQHFILFALSNGGVDLESYKIQKQRESYSIFYQIALTLAIAEEALEFEHRDLHIGNILIDTCREGEIIRYMYEGNYIDIKSCGVRSSIIDFTNSRIRKDELVVYIDLSEDEAIFQGQGDYQFDIYRMMRKENNNNWVDFTPKTNLLWLHYVSRKLFDIPRLFRKRRQPLLELFNKLLTFERVKDLLDDEQFSEEFAEYRV